MRATAAASAADFERTLGERRERSAAEFTAQMAQQDQALAAVQERADLLGREAEEDRRTAAAESARALEAAADGWTTGVAGGETRFQVFARVLRIADGDLGVIVKADVPPAGDDPNVPGAVESITSVYAGADWHEREAYDFFGIVFDGHPALTRIQMPDDWPGHPQRKDYPLGGIPVEYKGATIPPPDTRRSYN